MPYKANIDLTNIKSLTQNKNFMNGVAFKCVIDKTFAPNVEYFCTEASLPDITVNPALQYTPQRNAYQQGDKAEYAPLELAFLVDEDMTNFKEMHDWLLAEVIQKDTGQTTRDITLSIVTSHNNVIQSIQFVDCIPTNLSGLNFNLQQTDTQYLTARATFQYSYYKFI